MLQLHADKSEAAVEVYLHKELLESLVDEFITNAGQPYTTENRLQVLHGMFAHETAASTKRISDLEEQVKLLLTRSEG